MKQVLIVKTGAAGDVLRTTFILESLIKNCEVHWLTDQNCVDLIDPTLTTVYTDIAQLPPIVFDYVYCLEEDSQLLKTVQEETVCKKYIGYYLDHGTIYYTSPNREWFDMSLNSRYGIIEANRLKLANRKTFQDLVAPIFELEFNNEKYNKLNYTPEDAIVVGNIAIAKSAGAKWPNKNWAYYDELKTLLQGLGYTVNYLPTRDNIKQHIADIAAHDLIIGGDSLPMHIATALEKPSIALFTCTSPWEIYDYNLITKIVSSKLPEYYYQRELTKDCTVSISVEEVYTVVKNILK